MGITMNTKQMSELVGLKENSICVMVKRGTLETKLQKCGWKLLKSYKVGREHFFEVEKLEQTRWEEIQTKYDIRNKHKHNVFSKERIENLDKSCASVIRNCSVDITEKTARRYEQMLVDENIIQFDKEVYVRKNLKTGEMEFVDREVYQRYWFEHWALKYMLKKLEISLLKNEVTLKQYNELRDDAYCNYGEGDIRMYKYNSYKEVQVTQNILKQICKCLEKDINNITSQNKEVTNNG